MKRLPGWIAVVLAAAGIFALYADAIGTRFLNDDYLFLEEARTRPLAATIGEAGTLGNYYRPLSRQVYFEILTPLAGGHPLVFHLANALWFAVALVLLWDLLRAFLPKAGAMAGCLYFALLPFQRVNLTWVSCSQDLIALALALASLALFRRGRQGLALVAFTLALGAKEAAVALPVALWAWSVLVARDSWRRATRLALPFAAIAVAWMALAHAIVRFRGDTVFLRLDVEHFAAGYVHLFQSLIGLDAPDALAALGRVGPRLVPLLLLAPLAWWYARASRESAAEPRSPRTTWAFAGVWLLAFGAITGPVSHTWSSYYYTLCAVGGALLVGSMLRRGDGWVWLLLVTGLLWWHAAVTRVPAFALAGPWSWTSHLTSFFFERGAAIADSMSRQLVRLEPDPAPATRFFFATLPPWAGFQMGNGALIRDLYRDPTLESYFYSQFSDTTAADHPVRFLYWDNARLNELYPRQRDPFFQVATDLLLLDRPHGAVHALRRGLAAGGDPKDHLYWLGWAMLWSGHRAAAEAAWERFGAVEDSASWDLLIRHARQSLIDRRDTLSARRYLIRAIEHGIGRPEGHAVLGELLLDERPKYGALELKVASWLKPDDWIARRGLALALAQARLEEPAERELRALMAIHPRWRADSAVVQAWRAIAREDVKREVARF